VTFIYLEVLVVENSFTLVTGTTGIVPVPSTGTRNLCVSIIFEV
jgi:hypothetical protein